MNNPLHSYLGHRYEHTPFNTMETYGADLPENREKYTSSTDLSEIPVEYRVDSPWKYQFNSLGYRGEEFNPFADFRVFVVGCSHTFGTGIRWEQTYGYQFTKKLGAYYGKRECNYLNFSQGGASNCYVGRTALSQLALAQPDILVVQFTEPARREHIEGKRSKIFGSWSASENATMIGFLEWYTDELGWLHLLRQMLLVQLLAEKLNTPYLFLCSKYRELKKLRTNPYIQEILSLIDERALAPFFLPAKDKARDSYHHGPQSNLEFAEQLVDFYLELYPTVPGKRRTASPLRS